MRRWTAVIALAAVVVVGTAGCAPAEPALEIAEREGVFAPLSISASGLEPGAVVTLTAATEIDGARFGAEAEYLVGDDGGLDFADAVPESGDWTVAHPMAPFWSLAGPESRPFEAWDEPYTVDLTVRDDAGAALAQASVDRPGAAPGVVVATVTDDGVDGVYALPGDLEPGETRPSVLVFSGSDGGIAFAAATARWLAGLGYPALGISYFGRPGQPLQLNDVPVETFEAGLAWLRSQPEADLDEVYTFGVSRGGEMALWMASEHHEEVRGAIAPVGSGALVCGYPATTEHAWLRGGEPLRDTCARTITTDPDPVVAIDVAAIDGPVVLACGTEDRLWDSCTALDDVVQRRGDDSDTRATRGEGATHFVTTPPYQPWYIDGTSAAETDATQLVQAAFWQDVADVLAEAR